MVKINLTKLESAAYMALDDVQRLVDCIEYCIDRNTKDGYTITYNLMERPHIEVTVNGNTILTNWVRLELQAFGPYHAVENALGKFKISSEVYRKGFEGTLTNVIEKLAEFSLDDYVC